jgi:RNA 3'-terminal phosphate cyclase (ATP)
LPNDGLQAIKKPMTTQETIHIDGSYGEGGGQIIRTSVSLAALTGKAVEISNVRARRSRPGLQPQHLTAVRAAAALCGAELEGAEVGTPRFVFRPQRAPVPGAHRFDIGTAGATPLVAQTVLVPLMHAGEDSHVVIRGGTHVPHAPTAEYLEAVYIPALKRAGLHARFDYPRAGFFPKGGGELDLAVSAGGSPQALDLTARGRLVSLTAYIVAAELPDHVVERGAGTVEAFMKSVGRKVTVERRQKQALNPGAAVVVVAECEGGLAGFVGLGERGKPMEEVAQKPCEAFMEWWKSGAACDEHLADQLVLPLALAAGESRWTTPVVTEHLRTVLWLTEHFLPIRCTIEEAPEGCATVVLQGAAFRL